MNTKYVSKDGLYSSLKNYSESNAYPFHMPGHKRNSELLGSILPYDIDITEIHGFDDLHAPSGILLKSAEKLKKLYHSEQAYVLVGGSTCGILSAISSVTHRGDTVIVARNCHKSVYNGCLLSELDVRFVYPPMTNHGICGSISPSTIKAALDECSSAKAVIITSPTYEGVVSDVQTIAEICHSRDIPLIVDAAHGAHMPFCKFGKKGEPISSGADIVITSLHKTLPSLTQTAAAFVNGELVSAERFQKSLDIFETSSPSYILMASADACLDFIMAGRKTFAAYEKNLLSFYESVSGLEHIGVLSSASSEQIFSFDIGKIVITTNGTDITGTQLADRLREKYSLELEMAYPTYALAMTSVCDTPKGLERLSKALLETDKTLTSTKNAPTFPSLPKPMKIRMTAAEIDSLPDVALTRERAASGRHISRDYIYAYPPGIPIVAPGEIVGTFEYEYIELLKKSGINIRYK